MDITKELNNLNGVSNIAPNVTQTNSIDVALNPVLDDLDLTDGITNTEEILTMEEKLHEGLFYLVRKFSDDSCIYWLATLNEELLKLKGLDSSGDYLFDYDTGIEINWSMLSKLEIVSKEFIDSLPALDKFLNGGVKRCF